MADVAGMICDRERRFQNDLATSGQLPESLFRTMSPIMDKRNDEVQGSPNSERRAEQPADP